MTERVVAVIVALVAASVVAAVLSRGRYRRPGEIGQLRRPALAGGLAVLVATTVMASVRLEPAIIGVAATFLLVALPVSWIDVDVHRIPNWLTVASFVSLGAAAMLTAAALDVWSRVGLAALVAVAAVAYFWLLNRFFGLGGGDVKFAPTLGLVLGWWGWPGLAVGLVVTVLAALLAAVAGLALGRRRQSELPYGVAMSLGGIATIVVFSH